jgi:hypothetical protein
MISIRKGPYLIVKMKRLKTAIAAEIKTFLDELCPKA